MAICLTSLQLSSLVQADPIKLVDNDYLKLESAIVASQGFTYSDKNTYIGGGNFNFRESVFGLIASSKKFPGLSVSVQGEYRTAGGLDQDPSWRMGHMFIGYHTHPIDGLHVEVKGGRVRNPLGLYNETRDILWTRPGVSLPQSVYLEGLGLRQFESFIHGGRFDTEYEYGNHSIGAGFLIGEEPLGAGGNRLLALNIPNQGEFSGPPTFAYYATYSYQDYLLLKFYQLRRDQALGLSTPLPMFNIHGIVSVDVQTVLSARATYGPVAITSEYALFNLSRDFGVNIPILHGSELDIPIEGWYVQGEYNVLNNVKLLTRYDTQGFSFKDSRGGALPIGVADTSANDIVFGVNWKITPHVLLSTEYHRVHGTIWLNKVDNPKIEDNQYNLWQAMISVRF